MRIPLWWSALGRRERLSWARRIRRSSGIGGLLRICWGRPAAIRGMPSARRAAQAGARRRRWRRGCAPYQRAATGAAPFASRRAFAGCTASSPRRAEFRDTAAGTRRTSPISFPSRGLSRAASAIRLSCCRRWRAGMARTWGHCGTRPTTMSRRWTGTSAGCGWAGALISATRRWIRRWRAFAARRRAFLRSWAARWRKAGLILTRRKRRFG